MSDSPPGNSRSESGRRLPLPIDPELPRVVGALERGACLVLQAEPGTGKTTRVPPAFLGASFRREEEEILVLEPRRLAAKMAARRVAEELGEAVGETVGYQFRFENVSGSRTRIRFLTEGMLMRRLLGDPELQGDARAGTRRVAIVILDEFHERHLHTDVAIAFLRRLQLKSRPELRLVIMSATIDTAAIARYLGDCEVIQVEGKRFSVAVEYAPLAPGQWLDSAVRDVVSKEVAESSGDVLVFLPGMAEIRRAQQALEDRARRDGFLVLPLHGDLSREEQDRAIGRTDRAKVILSTNIAETSLTIPGVSTVIDSGLARIASYSWWSGLPALKTRPISRASAIQRAGRAGRLGPGRCVRLYSKADFEGRPAFDVPEILRADLSQTVLELKALGIDDGASFPWFEPPPAQAILAAESLLYRLGASTGQSEPESDTKARAPGGGITALGRRMVEMPTHPRLARLVLEAERGGCAEAGALLAAALSEGRLEPARAPAGPLSFGTAIDLISAFLEFHPDELTLKVRDRLWRSGARGRGGRAPSADERALRQALLRGFPDRVARVRRLGSGVSRPGSSRGGTNAASFVELVFSSGGSALVEESALSGPSEFWIAVDAVERDAGRRTSEHRGSQGQARSQVYVRSLCSIEPEWLLDLEPSGVQETDELLWDLERERVEQVSRMSYDQLVLSESRGAPQDPNEASRVLAKAVFGPVAGLSSETLQERISRVWTGEEWSTLVHRIAFLSARRPELGLPDLSRPEPLRELLEVLCQGRVSLSELRSSDPAAEALGHLTEDQRRALERLAPTHVQLPRGRRVKIHYEPGKQPWIESRLQDFLGMTEGPAILGGSAPLTLHLLAPNQRAVQVTSDLAGFWKRVYPELRRELGRRYPRHAWPEDPLAGRE